MEQGNEGDEIIFLTVRQIGCTLPDSVQKVGDISPELLIEIISRALFLISKGEIQCPTTLPNNIAARHRICTDIALKIKELGYPSDCGYNQLLYPIEHHTRDLLKYIIFKVPRTQEEGSEELVGANAILNRNIHRSLQKWQASLWRVPCCLTDRPLTNIYKTKPFQSSAADRAQHLAARLLAQHLTQKSLETVRTEQLNRKFLAKQKGSSSAATSAADAADLKALEQAAFLQQRVQAALQAAVQSRASAAGQSASGSSSADAATRTDSSQLAEGKDLEEDGDAMSRGRTQEDKMAEQMGYSLQELVHHIAQNKAAGGAAASSSSSAAGSADGQHPSGGSSSSASSALRETRFAHATQFAHEDSTSLGTGASALSGASSLLAAGGASAGSTGQDVYQATYQSAFQAALAAGLASSSQAAMQARQAALTAALAQVKGDLQERKRLLEQEEAQRVEELRRTRESLEEHSLLVDQQVREEEALTQTVAALEEEVARLHAETDKFEKDCVVKRQALELVPSASENILRLQEVCDKGAQKLRLLEEEWDSVQAPLIEELAAKERRKAARVHRVATLLEEMERYRELMGPMVADLQEKQQRAEILHEETAKLNKNLNRALYTHRILDITQSIAKQNKEIAKITGDIRDLQKTINLNTNTLHRADAITEELIFKAASDTSDAVMVDTYRRLKVLRSTFDNLLNTLSEIGLIEKSSRDLETKIEVEKGRVASMNYDRINTDLQAILAENQKLLAEVKALANRK